MKSLKFFSALCTRTCHGRSVNFLVNKRPCIPVAKDFPARHFSARTDDKTIPTVPILKDDTKPIETDPNAERDGQRRQTFRERLVCSIDEWMFHFEERAKTDPSLTIDWEQEAVGKVPEWPFLVLSKMVSVQRRVDRLYENATTLVDYLESRLEDGTYKKKNFDIIRLTGEVSLLVHQREDYEGAIGRYREILRRSTAGDGELILDYVTCNALIAAISKTDQWKECLRLLKTCRLTQPPGPTACSHVLRAALREKDEKVVGHMLAELEVVESQPLAWAYEALARHKSLPYLVKVLRDHRWILSEEAADVLKTHYEKNAVVEKVTLDKRSCPNCGESIMPSRRIPDAEKRALVERFSDRVFVRNGDPFLNSDPEEVERFKRFLGSCPKHDVVVDAMNVMCSVQRGAFNFRSDLLSRTINYFWNAGKRLLVLSKAHTEKSLEPLIRSTRRPERPVDWFFTRDQSKDDLFLLYASLHGNDDCLLLTKDQLRDHRFLLGPEMALVFKRWQQKQQVVFKSFNPQTRKILFKWPPPHEVVTQMSKKGTVHIPYMDADQQQESFSHTNSWLCIKDFSEQAEKKKR